MCALLSGPDYQLKHSFIFLNTAYQKEETGEILDAVECHIVGQVDRQWAVFF